MRKFLSLFALALLTMSAWGANTFVKVNSLYQLESGKHLILVNEGNSCAMGGLSGTSTPYGSAVAVNIIDDVIDIEGTDVVELTFVDGWFNDDGVPEALITMGGDDAFLAWSSGNSLTTVEVCNTDNSVWIVSSTDDGFMLINLADNTRKLQYNASSPRFACYTSSQQPAVLYVESGSQDEGITSLSQANALEDGENFAFDGNAVVTVQKDNYLFVRDESGYGLIYGALDDTFENGQVLNQGWNATKTSDNGWVRFIEADGLSASGETNAELAAPQVVTSIDESMLNAYVCFENVTVSLFTRSIKLEDGTSIPMYNMFNLNMPASGFPGMSDRHHNAYGVIGMQSGVLKFIPVDFVEVVEPQFLRGDANDDGVVNIDDVTTLIDYVLSGDASTVNLNGADCNQDGAVTLDDVTSLIDYVLSHIWY